MNANVRMVSPVMRVFLVVLAALLVVTGFQLDAPKASAAADKVIVGYWHNFNNGSTNIRLRDISTNYNVIQVAFAVPTGATTGIMTFSPYNATVAEFQSDIDFLQARGQKVLISIGGANGAVELTTATARQNFVNTMISIIDTYGFDGMDIDLEGSSLSLNSGDTNFRSPTSPKITNMITAIQDILSNYSSSFLLTMAPETAYVQGGRGNYGGIWGAYLPLIYAFRNDIDYLHVQHYNSGTMYGPDGGIYTQGTADFHVAMAEMLLVGFPVAGNTNDMFPALRPDQVLIGLPSSSQAAGGGYTAPADVQNALNYLVKGQSFGGSYVLRNPAGYPAFRGLMTWSINWDLYNNNLFSNSHRTFLDQLPAVGGGGDTIAPSVPTNLTSPSKTTSSVTLSWNASTDNVGVTGYIVSYGSNQTTVSGTSATISGLSANTAYTFTVRARDAAGNQSGASSSLTVTTNAQSGGDTSAPTVPGNFRTTGNTSNSITLAWNASSDNVGVTGYRISYGSTTITVTGTSTTISGLSANTTYAFTIRAIDAASNQSGTASLSVTTNAAAGAPAWAPYVSYQVGNLVTYNGVTYSCRQSHTSLPGWEPILTLALWLPV